MSVQAIVDKIKHDATEQASALRASATEQAEAIATQTQADITSLEQAAAAALEKEQAHRRAVRLSLATQTANQQQYAAKRELVDAVLDAAYQEIKDEPAEAYTARFTALAQACDIVPTAVQKIYTAPARTEEASAIAAACGWEASVEADPRLAGGLRVEGSDVAFDLSLAGLFAERRRDLEMAVATQLFVE